MTTPEGSLAGPSISAVPIDRGWREQLRRVSELALLGIVAALASVPIVTVGAVIATLSVAVGHWADHDDLPSWRAMGRELLRRLVPGAAVSVVAVLAVLLVTQEVAWLRSGAVPGGGVALTAQAIALTCLFAVVLLALPRLADGSTWRTALSRGWTDLLRAPHAGAAAVGVTAVAALLAVLLPGVFLLLPALVMLALHTLHRRLVPPR